MAMEIGGTQVIRFKLAMRLMPRYCRAQIMEWSDFFTSLAVRIKRDQKPVAIEFDRKPDGRFSVKVLDKYKTVIHPSGKIEIESSDVSELIVMPAGDPKTGGFEFDA